MADKTKDPKDDPVRKVRMSKELIDQFATRNEDGYRVVWDWGEPDEDGFYIPTVTVDTSDLAATPGGLGDKVGDG